MFGRRSNTEAVKELSGLTGLSRTEASRLLQQHGNNLERAADVFFTGGNRVDVNETEKVFNKYKEPNGKEIGIDGTIQYIQDLGLELEDPVVLAICTELKAPAQGSFTKEGFIEGWKALGCDSLAKMKKQIPVLRTKFENDDAYFTSVYRYTFLYYLTEGQKVLSFEIASQLWEMLLKSRYRELPKWFDFLNQEYANKNISKDTWNMIWDFAKYHKTDPKLENYDIEGSWPTIIDEYVEYLQARL
ncbi:defective in cullin neddylation protein 1 [Trichomonascus vanleenenianus]|uniref:NEDD8 ligase DCN1 n=1 Tax=Trichomonascus vanleenenianus TaxID=2268995 RepID=UPI003EC9A4C5